jgi:hypothetical protein
MKKIILNQKVFMPNRYIFLNRKEVLINGVTKLLQMPDVVAANPNINMPSGSSPPASLPTSYIAVQGPVPARTAADLSTQQITQPLIDAYAILKPEQVVHTGGYAAQAVAHGSHYQNAVVHVPQNMPAGIVYVQQGAGAGAGYGPAQPQLGQQVQQYGGATIAYQQQPSQQQYDDWFDAEEEAYAEAYAKALDVELESEKRQHSQTATINAKNDEVFIPVFLRKK